MIENKTKLEQQKTWLAKKENYLKHRIEVVKEKITSTKAKDRRLRGLMMTIYAAFFLTKLVKIYKPWRFSFGAGLAFSLLWYITTYFL